MESVDRQNIFSKILTAGLSCFLALFLSVPGHSNEPASRTGEFRLGLVAFVGEAIHFHALEKNYFQDAGIRVKPMVQPSGAQSILKLMAGELDICAVESVPVVYNAMQPHNGPPPFKIIVSILESSGMNNLVLTDTRKTPGIKDLEGKTLALAKGTSSDYSWYMFAMMNGIDTTGIDIIDMAVPDMPEAAGDGKMDGAVAWSPYHRQIVQKTAPHGRSIEMKRVYTTNWLVLARPELIKDSPDGVSAYLTALLRSKQDFFTNPAAVAESHAGYVNQSPAELMADYGQLRMDLNLTETILINLHQIAVWAKNQGYAAGRIPDFSEFIDAGPLLRIDPNLVRLIQ